MELKGVIVAAGYGSRFLPVTKTVPKEMLPLIDTPAISFVVDEFLQAEIRDILIITSRRKKSLEDFFDREIELEGVFEREGKETARSAVEPPQARFFFTRQQAMKGTGHALLLARPFTGDHPFVVAYPDDIFLSEKSVSLQLAHAYADKGCSVLGVGVRSGPELSRYGVVRPLGDFPHEEDLCPVASFVEKPPAATGPSLVSYGRYLFTPEIYPHLQAGLENHRQGEYYHVEAINRLAGQGRLFALKLDGSRLDTGEPAGYLEAICRYALHRPDMEAFAKKLFAELASSNPRRA